jgi:hypothetical protein
VCVDAAALILFGAAATPLIYLVSKDGANQEAYFEKNAKK